MSPIGRKKIYALDPTWSYIRSKRCTPMAKVKSSARGTGIRRWLARIHRWLCGCEKRGVSGGFSDTRVHISWAARGDACGVCHLSTGSEYVAIKTALRKLLSSEAQEVDTFSTLQLSQQGTVAEKP